METEAAVRQAFVRGAQGSDFSLIEGNHGLYDDSLSDDGATSTAALARQLQSPVILVVNAARMARSVAAMVRGYQLFEPQTNIAAVILNNVAHSRHEQKLRQAIERYCYLPVVGAIPRDDALAIPDRHLGLIPCAEDDALLPAVAACRRMAQQSIDLDAVLALAQTVPLLPEQTDDRPGAIPEPVVRLGVIRDKAFSFYYPANFEALTEAGAELVFIDALVDPALPPVDGLYIGGGFPEMFMAQLSANVSLRHDIRRAAEAGLPVYAECGGLMYLCRRIVRGDQSAEMVGALPAEVELTDHPQGHGYVLARAEAGNPFLPAGTIMRGHEFHHSRVINLPADLQTGYRLSRGKGLGGGRDGWVHRNILAGYTHLHAAGSPGWAKGLVKQAIIYKKEHR